MAAYQKHKAAVLRVDLVRLGGWGDFSQKTVELIDNVYNKRKALIQEFESKYLSGQPPVAPTPAGGLASSGAGVRTHLDGQQEENRCCCCGGIRPSLERKVQHTGDDSTGTLVDRFPVVKKEEEEEE